MPVTLPEKKFVLVPFDPVKSASAVVPLKVFVFEKVFAVYVFGIVVELLMYESTRALVKYRLLPSATFVVRSPKVEVESCWYEPPAYEPRRMPAAEGFAMPVPPPPAVKVPLREEVKVRAPFEGMTVMSVESPLKEPVVVEKVMAVWVVEANPEPSAVRYVPAAW